MKIELFIVTYKNDSMLLRCLESIHNEIITKEKQDIINVTIINNYQALSLGLADHNYAKIIDNAARPDFSTGHLARNWNQCILHGIQDINVPKNDVVILAQNDVVFKPGFIKNIKQHLDRYNYITFGRGDELQIITPDAIKNIGLYDERFCNIGFQEADYFLRAVLLNPKLSSINDNFHKRIHNPIINNVIEDVQSGYQRCDTTHIESSKFHNVSLNMFFYKWMGLLPNTCNGGTKDTNYPYENWNDFIKNTPICAKQYIMYPYFECNLPNLDKKYINYTTFF